MIKKLNAFAAILLTVLVALPASSYAVGSGGFENASFGAGDYGKGTAATANPTNPATISINPAGLNELPGIQIQTNMNMINVWTNMEARRETTRGDGGSSRSSATTVPVPTFYISANPGNKLGLNNRLALGLGVDSPFGLSNKYNSGFTAVHYTGYRNWIKMYAIKPVASFRIADWLNIGAGPIFYRAFDVGQIAAYPNFALGGGTDGQIRANMSGNSWGWHMGVLAKPAPKHKFGFYFRSPAIIHLKGLLKGENIFIGAGDSSGAFETGVHTKMHLPLNMTWGYNYQITEKTDIGLDLGWTKWSSFDNFYAPVDTIVGSNVAATNNGLLNDLFNTPGPGGSGDKDWHNSFTLAIGGEHKVNKKFRIRAGTYYYWTPIPKYHFTPVVPDANRWTTTIGFGYDITRNLTLDAAYAAQFFAGRKIDNDVSESLSTSVDGTYKSFLQVWTAGITYKFGEMQPKPEVEQMMGATKA